MSKNESKNQSHAQQNRISVDAHVHRIANRWGYVDTSAPSETLVVLESKVPQPLWKNVNRVLVPFGKYVCTTMAPKCSTCLVLEMCRQVGMTRHR